MAEIRRIDTNAGIPEIIAGINRAFDILKGNVGGQFYLQDSDGIARDIRGGAQLSTGNFSLKIRSGAGNHLDVRDSTDLASRLRVTDAQVLMSVNDVQIIGTTPRFTGEFSNATLANRLLFQTYIVNGATAVGAIPNGTGTTAEWVAYNNSAPASATGAASLRATATAVELKAENPSGAGALPMDFYTNATHQWRLDTAGALIAQGTGKRIMGDLSNATLASRLMVQNSVVNAVSNLGIMPNGSGTGSTLSVFNSSNLAATQVGQWQITATEIRIQSHHIGASYLPLTFYNNGAMQAQLPAAGGFEVTAIDPPASDTQVTAGSQCKASAYVVGATGALGDNYNIASVTRNGAGDYTIAWDRDFTSATYEVYVTVEDNAAFLIGKCNSKTSSSADIHITTPAGVLTDPDGFSVQARGTLV